MKLLMMFCAPNPTPMATAPETKAKAVKGSYDQHRKSEEVEYSTHQVNHIGFDLARRHTGCDEVGNPANQQVTQNQHRGNQQQLPQRVVLTAEREQNLV